MATITEEEQQALYENFETMWLLEAVDHLDNVRGHLANGPNFEPPEIRDQLMDLHGMAMNVVNHDQTEQIQEMFDLADDLDMDVFRMLESLEAIHETLRKLRELYPESLVE